MALYKDPRLDPTLRPDQWARAARRRRFVAAIKVLLVLAVAAGIAGYILYPVDRTADMTPEEVARAAGETLLELPAYGFSVDITGDSGDLFFPDAHMQGVYQRDPRLLHLAGEVKSGESRLQLEYYLTGDDVYIRDPRNGNWLLLRNTVLDELSSFQPDNLAAPLVTGVLEAEVVGRDQLPGGEAVMLDLKLDPDVMLPRLESLHDDRTTYRLWVYARTLLPARFDIDVQRAPDGDGEDVIAQRFSYRLVWDFQRPEEPLSVPAEVVESAVDIDRDDRRPDLLRQRDQDSGDGTEG